MKNNPLQEDLSSDEEFLQEIASLPPHEVIERMHQRYDRKEETPIVLPDLDDFPDDDPNDPELQILLRREEELKKRRSLG